MNRAARLRTILGGAYLASFVAACGGSDGPSGPTTGAIAIASAAATTIDNAAFDYTITVDNGAPRIVATAVPSSFVVTDLSAGTHAVTIGALANGCVAGTPSRSVTVVAGDTVPVTFDVQCARTTGDFTVTSSTTGVELDGDGYTVIVDGANRGIVNSSGNITVRLLTPGPHTVSLSGLSTNCTPSAATKTVNITAGTTTPVTFDVACVARNRVIRLDMTTTGAEFDPNGYVVLIDNTVVRVPANGTFRLTGVPVGRRAVDVFDVAGNCALLVPPIRDIDIELADDTVAVPVTAVCVARGAGNVAFTVVDAANDTLPNASDPIPAIDLISTTGRYAPGWFLLSMRFAAPVVPGILRASNSVTGIIDLDTDELTTTGYEPFANRYSTFRSQGVEVTMFIDADSTQALLYRNMVLVGSAGLQIAGDSMVLSMPLALLNDDGNLTVTGLVGTLARPTDVAPNTGVITARRPASIATEPVAGTGPAVLSFSSTRPAATAVYGAGSGQRTASPVSAVLSRWRRSSGALSARRPDVYFRR